MILEAHAFGPMTERSRVCSDRSMHQSEMTLRVKRYRAIGLVRINVCYSPILLKNCGSKSKSIEGLN